MDEEGGIPSECTGMKEGGNMAGYRLCRVKTAENPFFLENISTNIYSIEELCYFFTNNVPLLDATVMNTRLTSWVATELGQPRLALKMEHAMTRRNSIMEFVTTVFREIGYFSQNELIRYTDNMSAFLNLPSPLKMKLKGDSLCRAGKYTASARVYRQIIDEADNVEFQSAFLSSVWHNRGVAEMKLMLFDEALSSLRKSMELRPTREHVMSYVEALGMTRPRGKYREDISKLRSYLSELPDEKDFDDDVIRETEEVLSVVRKGIEVEIPEDIYAFVQDLAEEYHASTGA